MDITLQDMHVTSHARTWVGSGFKQLLKKGHDQIKETRTAENVHHELVVEFKQLPEDDVKLLSEEDLLDGVREIGAPQRIAQQSCQTLGYEL